MKQFLFCWDLGAAFTIPLGIIMCISFLISLISGEPIIVNGAETTAIADKTTAVFGSLFLSLLGFLYLRFARNALYRFFEVKESVWASSAKALK